MPLQIATLEHMPSTSPARIDDDLYASAKLAGEVQSRSASQQVVHWARIGREIEASASISLRDITAVLAGTRSYDDLTPREQAVVRAEWSDRIDEMREGLNLARDLAAAGQPWVELNDDGEVVQRARPARKVSKATAAAKKPAAGVKTAKASGRRSGSRSTR